MTSIAPVSTTPTIRPAPVASARAQDNQGNNRDNDRQEAIAKANEQRQLAELRARDQEVRAHERAHLLAAGPHANGAPSYQLVRGPDGRYYAVGGSVSIDTSTVPDDPQATMDKAETIKRAALAPMQPSGQDFQVAAQAEAMRLRAQVELQTERREESAEARQDDNDNATIGESTPATASASEQALASYRDVAAMA